MDNDNCDHLALYVNNNEVIETAGVSTKVYNDIPDNANDAMYERTAEKVADQIAKINSWISIGQTVGRTVQKILLNKDQKTGISNASNAAQFIANMFNPTAQVGKGIGDISQGRILDGLNHLINPFRSIKDNDILKKQLAEQHALHNANIVRAKLKLDENNIAVDSLTLQILTNEQLAIILSMPDKKPVSIVQTVSPVIQTVIPAKQFSFLDYPTEFIYNLIY